MIIDIMTRCCDIVILHEYKIKHSNITVFYDSLPMSKPFQSYLLNSGNHEREKSSILALYALHASVHVSFKMVAQKHMLFQLVGS